MANDILFALWFFVPAGIANVTPILAAKTPGLKGWTTPLDGGRSWRGKRVLDDHKTWRGIITGVLLGTAAFGLQSALYRHTAWAVRVSDPLNYAHLSLAFGLLMSFGALAGDALKSFFKRQFGVPSGKSWFPFDQLDYIIGGLLFSSLAIRLSFSRYFWVIIVWFGLHLIFSYIGYLTKFKDSPI